MRSIEHKLRRKGWSEKEIDYSVKVFAQAKEKKQKHLVFMESLLEFFIAITIIAATFTISIVLVPIFIVMNSSWLFLLLIAILGLSIGLIFEFLIHQLETFESRHHIMFSVLVPLIVVINIIITVSISNKLIDQLKLSKPHQNAIVISLVYTFFFLLPYVLAHIRFHREKKRMEENKKMG